MTLIFKIVLPLVILAIGGSGMAYLKASKPVEKPVLVEERVWNVAVERVQLGELAPEVQLFGTLIASRDVELRSLVAGEVIGVATDFKEGARIEKGDLLVEIDPFDFEALLAERKASALEAKSRLIELKALKRSEQASLARDREILALDVRNLKRSEKLSKRGNISEKSLDDARSALSRQMQQVEQRDAQLDIHRARIGQQEAVLVRFEVGVKRAERDLSNTRLIAPFAGYISDIGAELGKRIDVKDKVARLIDAGQLEVEFHLSDKQYGLLIASKGGVFGRSIKVSWRTGDIVHDFAGKIARIGSEMKAETGGVDIYAVLDANTLIAEARSGAFVDVILTGETYGNAVRIPEQSVYSKNTVYVVEEGRLEARDVKILFDNGTSLLVAGDLKDGDQLVTTRFSEIGPGIRVEVR
ncbi:MAG: efflux RND transporter periplasmic adaptor subunit [Sneathiella sp.]|nr:efflux RND transporter periplasmic adaptor subunit [Sneathiella sp.]